jgi:predicted TIM-barrel fold metal-dependent hydrolase
LLWASNYPRWDCESPADCSVLAHAAEGARRRILGGNAAALYGLSARERQEEAVAATAD